MRGVTSLAFTHHPRFNAGVRVPTPGFGLALTHLIINGSKLERILRGKAGRPAILFNGSIIDTVRPWALPEKISNKSDATLRFTDLRMACEEFFGKSRQAGTSHLIFKMP